MKALALFFGIWVMALIFSSSVYAQAGLGPGWGSQYGGQKNQTSAPPSKECQDFLKDTQGLRKELANKKSEYEKAARDPKTERETKSKLEDQIEDLQKKIESQNTHHCSW